MDTRFLVATPIRVAASQTLHRGPVLLTFLYLSGDGAAADANIYDGINAQGQHRFHMEAANGDSASLSFHVPVMFLDGLHAVLNAATTTLTAGIIPLPRETLTEIIRGL